MYGNRISGNIVPKGFPDILQSEYNMPPKPCSNDYVRPRTRDPCFILLVV